MSGYHRLIVRAEAKPVVYEGMRTPWGNADSVRVVAPGIGWVGTSGHGGAKLTPAMTRLMPDYMREKGGWYEEDCDWALPFVALSDLLRNSGVDEKILAEAVETLRHWRPDAYEQFFSEEIPEGASHIKDKRIFSDRHANDLVVISAITSDARPGMVEVMATIGGVRDFSGAKKFFVPQEEYSARGTFGFVIDDPAKYEEIAVRASTKTAFFHRDDTLLAGLSFTELIDAIHSNEPAIDEAAVRKVFSEIVQTQMQDAEHELAESMGQIIAEARA